MTPTTTAADHPAAGRLMATEIAEQPSVAERLLTHLPGLVHAVAGAIRTAGPRFVLLAARGSSDHAALYAKYLFEIVLGLPCGLASLSTITTYGGRPDLRDVLWVAISQSGESPDLVESTRVAGECGALTLALTNAPDSPLASTARLAVDIDAGLERSVAATKTYTASLLALWMLVDDLRGGRGEAARELPAHLQATLGGDTPDQVAATLVGTRRLVVTGRGYNYPTAREAALKLMETSYVSAQAFSGADLLHGPVAMVDHDQPVLVVAPDARSQTALRPVVDKLSSAGARIHLIGTYRGDSDGPDRQTAPRWPVPVVDDDLSPILSIVPLQRLALHLAIRQGFDPDRPRGLSKRTHTR